MSDDIVPLVRRCLRGDETAAAELVERHFGLVFGLCFRMLGHRQDAEDVAQDVFVRALRSLASWDSTRDFKPWLLAIAGNRCRTALAVRQRRVRAGTLVGEPPDESPLAAPSTGVAEEVALALGQLRGQYRQAFLLFHTQQLSYLEIASVLDCPVGTVKTWVHRARRELARTLIRRGVVEGVEV